MYHQRINKSDTIHQIYSNQKIKQQLIDTIYSMVDISKFKYKLLETTEDLPLLKTAKYYISGNFSGANCLLVFIRNKDRFYSFLVDRKTLSYRRNQINIDNVNVSPVELGLEESIYDGTIIDGILSQTDTQRIYIITDLYYFRGVDMTNEKVKYKLINIKKYLDAYLSRDKNMNNLTITVNNLYEIDTIDTLINKIIPQTTLLQVKGLAFYPDISGTKLIYLFNKQKQYEREQPQKQRLHIEKVKNVKNEEHIQYSPPVILETISKQKQRYIIKEGCHTPVIMTFELRKTEQSDVYKLFLVTKQEQNNKQILKTVKIGFACIPTLQCSQLCKSLTLTRNKALVKCVYDESKEKWIPQQEDKIRKCPDLLSTLEEKMDIIVDD